MSAWIDQSLIEAARALMKSDRPELARDLSRLLGLSDAVAFHVFRSPEVEALAARIEDADDLDALAATLGTAATAFGVSYLTIHAVEEVSGIAYAQKVLTTFPADFTEMYVARNLSAIDPVRLMARTRGEGFFWSEIQPDNPFTIQFLDAIDEAGIGRSGFTLTRRNRLGDLFAVSASTRREPLVFRHHFEPLLTDFAEVAALYIDAFTDFVAPRRTGSGGASAVQLRILRALAMGETLASAVTRFAPSSEPAVVEAALCRSLGARTLTQATVIAAREGCFEDLPLHGDDVYIAGPSGLDRGEPPDGP